MKLHHSAKSVGNVGAVAILATLPSLLPHTNRFKGLVLTFSCCHSHPPFKRNPSHSYPPFVGNSVILILPLIIETVSFETCPFFLYHFLLIPIHSSPSMSLAIFIISFTFILVHSNTFLFALISCNRSHSVSFLPSFVPLQPVPTHSIGSRSLSVLMIEFPFIPIFITLFPVTPIHSSPSGRLVIFIILFTFISMHSNPFWSIQALCNLFHFFLFPSIQPLYYVLYLA